MSRFPKAPSISRSVETLKPKVKIIIVCEGENTEPQYFSDCVTGYSSGLVSLEVLPNAGVPLTIVNRAIEIRHELLNERRKYKDSYESCFRVWVVFDRDEHPGVDEAIRMAIDNKVDVGFSNPCFELWPLLHLVNHGAQDGRHVVQARLTQAMPSYDHGHGARIDFPLIKDKFELAYSRANALLTSRINEGVPLGCPSTSVGILVKKIIENGKLRNRVAKL